MDCDHTLHYNTTNTLLLCLEKIPSQSRGFQKTYKNSTSLSPADSQVIWFLNPKKNIANIHHWMWRSKESSQFHTEIEHGKAQSPHTTPGHSCAFKDIVLTQSRLSEGLRQVTTITRSYSKFFFMGWKLGIFLVGYIIQYQGHTDGQLVRGI